MQELFGWFALTHEIQVGFGVAQWQRITLPYAGGLSEQPARLMEGLAWVCQQRNAQLLHHQGGSRRRRATRNG